VAVEVVEGRGPRAEAGMDRPPGPPSRRPRDPSPLGIGVAGSLLAVLLLFGASVPAAADRHAPFPGAALGPTAVARADTAPVTGPIAFVNVHVVDVVSGRVARDRTVLADGGRIRRVGAAAEVRVPGAYHRVEGEGRLYLLPGFTDAHVHLRETPEAWLPLFLANGVTTVFSLDGNPSVLGIRRRIAEGELVGPRIYTAGPLARQPEVSTPGQAARLIRRQKEAGYDFVKVYGRLSEAAHARLTEEGRRHGIAVVGHAPRGLPFDVVLAHGQSMVAHAEELVYTYFEDLDTARIRPLARRMAKAGTWLTPTLSTFHNIVRQWGMPSVSEDALRRPERRYLPPALARSWRKGNVYIGRDPDQEWPREAYRFQTELVGRLHGAGVPMLAGTDTPIPVMYPGFSIHEELRELELAGLGTVGALRAATSAAGRFVREHVDPTARFGQVREGYRADLIVVTSNPLDGLDVLRHPAGVLANGSWYGRMALEDLLDSVAGAVRAPRAETQP